MGGGESPQRVLGMVGIRARGGGHINFVGREEVPTLVTGSSMIFNE